MRNTRTEAKWNMSTKGKTTVTRPDRKITGKKRQSRGNSKPIPQKVLIHAARKLPTPEIFNEVPSKMPFPTDGD